MSRKSIKTMAQCRMCLRIMDNDFVKEIFNSTAETSEIYVLILETTGIEASLEDGASKICNNCEKILKTSRDFKNACLKANKLLIERISSIKQGMWMKKRTRTIISQFEDLVRGHKMELEELEIPIIEMESVKIEPEIDINPDFGLNEIGDVFYEEEAPTICTVCSYSEPTKQESVELNEEMEDLLAKSQQLNSEIMCSNCKILLSIISAYSYYRSNDSYEYLDTKLKCLKELLEKIIQKMDQNHQENFKTNYQNIIEVGVEVCVELFGQQEEKFKTKQCNKSNFRKPAQTGAKHVCHICGFKTRKRHSLTYHLNAHNNIRNLVCTEEGCGRAFTHPSTLYNHRIRVHSKAIFGECDFCGRQFKFRDNLSRHLKKHITPQAYLCVVCQKGFPTERQVQKHLRVHKSDKDKTHKCSFCPKKFFEIHNLKVHLRVHTLEKPFPCDKCELKFGYKCTLQAHQKKYHSQ